MFGMAALPSRVHRFILFTAIAALGLLLFCIWAYPLSLTQNSFRVLGVLLILSFTSELLALKVTEHGAKTSMDFVPQLAAVILIGPAGATILTAFSWTVGQTLLSDKPAHKALFNIGQAVVSVALGALAFIAAGGIPSLSEFNIDGLLLPFAIAVLVYFGVNSSAVAYIIAASEERQVREVWQELSFAPLILDLLVSSLALLVAYLYINWNALAMLAAIVPIIGLRYTYGVNLELKQLNSDLLRALINTIEAQDPYTSGHSLRVAEGALAISDALGINRRKRRAIETAALLHDIGKLDSSFHSILNKDAKLTKEEWQLVKQHPQRGVDMVQPIRSLDSRVHKYIMHHHEHYDGSGYPEGLAADNIPVGARVIMVADTIDAMVTARPYRDRIDPQRVREELKDKAGDQFDPELVKVALEIDLPQKMATAAHSQIREDSEQDTSIDGNL